MAPLIRTALVGLAFALAACSNPAGPDDAPPAGLFDDSPLLPALTAATAADWQWIQPAGMRARNGSATGFGLRRAPGSPDLLIVLQGGGACYDFLSCLLNPSRFNRDDFDAFVAAQGTAGVFDPSRAENPFRDWNVLFVPYSTGDVHGGDAPNTRVPGVFGRQDFVGYRNMEALLGAIAGSARRARRVVLAGESAGGFGTVLTYGLVAERLAPAPVDVLDDSGPTPEDNRVLDADLQQRWRELWNLDAAIPDACPECAQPDGDGLDLLLPYYARAYPERTFGLLSFTSDAVIRGFFGTADPDCGEGGSCFVGAGQFRDALFDYRGALPANVGTFYVEGDGHVFLLQDYFYTTSVEGTPLAGWVAALVAGQALDVPSGAQALAAGTR